MLVMKMCWRSQELLLIISQAIASIKPISPIRLYKIAWRAAVLASVRPNHQPISIKDIMPTPSQPMNSWKRLLADTKIIIVNRNVIRYLKNWWIYGSECIYHRENSKMDHVTYRAIGMKITEK